MGNGVHDRPRREKPERIADELRLSIVNGALSEGDSLGREPDLVKRFGVSRPSLREALRILEAEGLITVVRGVLGGVVVHRPDQRMTARTAALVLQTRDVSLSDVYTARSLLEPVAARVVAESRSRRSAARALAGLIAGEREVVTDPEAFGVANSAFHRRLVTLAGNETLTVIAEMLNEIVGRAVIAMRRDEGSPGSVGSVSMRRRAVRSQERLVSLIEAGAGLEAERHWRVHMGAVDRLLARHQESVPIDLMNHR